MAVEIESGSPNGSLGFRAGAPRALLKMPGRGWYAASADGNRFLTPSPVDREIAPLNLVLNWTGELGR